MRKSVLTDCFCGQIQAKKRGLKDFNNFWTKVAFRIRSLNRKSDTECNRVHKKSKHTDDTKILVSVNTSLIIYWSENMFLHLHNNYNPRLTTEKNHDRRVLNSRWLNRFLVLINTTRKLFVYPILILRVLQRKVQKYNVRIRFVNNKIILCYIFSFLSPWSWRD